MLKSNGGLPEGRSAGKEKEDSMELPRGPRTQATTNAPKLQATSFFPLQKLKGKHPTSKTLAVHLAHLEEEDAVRDEDVESEDPGGIEEVTKEFMVCSARAVKDAQAEEKCCITVVSWNILSIIVCS